MRYVPSGRGREFISYRKVARRSYIAFECNENISHERSEYIAKKVVMNDKTIKELAVELTVETTAVCDKIKGRAVFSIYKSTFAVMLVNWCKFS